MIYFLQATEGGPVKIGHTNNVKRRLEHLEFHYGRSLTLLGTREGGLRREREIQARFSHLRLGITEQFRPASDLMQFIGAPSTVDVNPMTVVVMEPAPEIRPPSFQVRGSLGFRRAIEEFAEFDGKSVPALFDHAIRLYARQSGFMKRIPKR